MKTIKIKGLDEKIFFQEINNLPVYMWENKKLDGFYLSLCLKYGSIHTSFSLNNKKYQVPNGSAHFMEHIKFNEKVDYTANDFYNEIGSDINAFTTFEYTNYEVFANKKFPENLNHLIEYVYNPFFSTKLINKEKGIIIEESKMIKDDPYTSLFFKLYQNLFFHCNYQNPVTGEEEDIKKIKLSDMKNIFQTFYQPANSFLVITGNFDSYEAVKIIENTLSNIDFSEYKKPVINEPMEKDKVVKKYEEITGNVKMPKIKIGFKYPRKIFQKFDLIKLRIMLSIILKSNFGVTSDFREECFEHDLIDELGSQYYFCDDYCIITFTISSKYPEEIITKVLEKYQNLQISEEVLRRRIKANIATLILDYDDMEIVSGNIQGDLITYQEIISNIKDIYNEITLEDINKLIKLLNSKNFAIVKMLPNEK